MRSHGQKLAYSLVAASLLLGGTASASPPAVPESGAGLQAMAKDQPFVTVPIESLKPAQAMEKPVLTPTGGQLILSDSPEMPTAPGAYYRDVVTGSFRVFYHHLNNTGAPLQIGAAVTNTSGYTVKLYEEGSGAGVDYYPDVAGQIALAAFLKDRGSKRPVAVLKPGESYWRTAEVPATHTLSGFLQLRAESASGGAAPVTVTTLGYAMRPADPLAEPVLPPDRHIRGTFPHYDRTGTLVYKTSAGNSLLRVDSSPSGQWADFMPGEYEQGVDATSGAAVLNPGNYGVIYDMSVEIENDSDERRTVGVYLNPSGGSGHYTIGWGGKLLNSGFLNYTMAWQLSEFNVGRKGKTVPSRLSLTGGSAGPQTLYFTSRPVK
ncbi:MULTISPECIES: hypothetical protein [unclassified Paenibacillus]|uniref:hypothetical protein n=1 Tax=unclassified Paenibacillus TaxID=185978 RepID=UPI000954140A|nr:MULTISPECIES: hypothetical protein [unclassified Paenibacillus]ASS68387.2 hypothetical protein CIC07_21310 [Paenibacillus sp. RUD330]SIR31607.1 hypothetical protein SAMN05880555_3448 [Paenibacillus sp. RU4X]SIR42917.1 hypothetical protein SAMN05880570_3449 [Paenibacillus sp. RU4T]